jgi:hypothetical protein
MSAGIGRFSGHVWEHSKVSQSRIHSPEDQRSRKVCFLIPASPTAGFMSQVAAFSHALKQLHWDRWQPSMLVCFGEAMEEAARKAYSLWRPHLQDVAIVFAPEANPNSHYEKQIDGVLRWAPRDADVLVRADADTLLVEPLEPTLDAVFEQSAIAGTIAHSPFRRPEGSTNRSLWQSLGKDLASAPVRFDYNYAFSSMEQPESERVTPFYLNDGFVFFARDYFDKFVPIFLEIRPKVAAKLVDPYYAGQVSLALAVMRIDLPAIALPMRYNFPNHVIAASKYPEEMERALVWHYLDYGEIHRQQIFQSEENYKEFLAKPLNKPNESFRNSVCRKFGQAYPFSPATAA